MKEEKKFCVYLHKNKINEKVYVGITSQNIEKRWKNGKGYSTQNYFYSAIQKYGWDSFEHIVLFINLTEKEAKYLEMLYVTIFRSNNVNFGYNMTQGGDSVNINCCREVFQYSIDGEFINSFISESEAKRKTGITTIGACCNGWKITAGNFRWAFADETPNMKIPKTNAKIVNQYNLAGILLNVYNSASDAGNKSKTNISHIVSCCNNKRKTAGGYLWEYVK